ASTESTSSINDDDRKTSRSATKPAEKPDTTAKKSITETTIAKRTVSIRSASSTLNTAKPKPVAPAESLAVVSTLGTASREAEQASSTQTVAVSPLGTPEQLAAEQRAAETVNTLPVKLMKRVLQFGWNSTTEHQSNRTGEPDQATLAALDEAVDEYAMGAAFQQQLLNPMTPTAVLQVAPLPTWYGQDVAGSRTLYANPDTIYRLMAVNNTSTYVITGQFNGEMPADTTFSVLTGLSGTTASVLSGEDLALNPDGSFTITV